jgi:hypothetical protein
MNSIAANAPPAMANSARTISSFFFLLSFVIVVRNNLTFAKISVVKFRAVAQHQRRKAVSGSRINLASLSVISCLDHCDL